VTDGRGIRIAVAPAGGGAFEEAIVAAGASVTSDQRAAHGIVWTDPRDPEGLGKLLEDARCSWVQLPFAGIEAFFAAGVMRPDLTWTCAKGIYGASTAEHALALLLAAARRLHEHARAKVWREGDFGAPERRLAGTTVLIVGTGGIGRALAQMLEPLGPCILAVNRSGSHMEGTEQTEKVVNLAAVLPEADFVVLAAAATDETRGLFDAAMFAHMKKRAWLVNVARGSLVVTEDLVDALEAGRLGGAALDVTDPEPLPEGHPLWDAPNAIITPHVANTWDMAVPELLALVRRNVAHFVNEEELEGLVDLSLGY
jgi:D-3-phosphoglycerate dehydrogenase